MKKFTGFIVMLFSLSFLSGQRLEVAFNAPENSPMFSLLNNWLQEVGDLAGVEFVLKSLSLEDAVEGVLDGTLDGDVGRTVYVYGEDARVVYTTHPASVIEYLIFTARDDINPEDIEQLKGLKLATSMGNRAIEEWVTENGIERVTYTPDSETALKMVSIGRADYYLGSAIFKNIVEKDPSLASVKILTHPVIAVPSFIVLNSKHRNLEPAISAAIKEMDESGRTGELFGLK